MWRKTKSGSVYKVKKGSKIKSHKKTYRTKKAAKRAAHKK
jgi:hypothetical protein